MGVQRHSKLLSGLAGPVLKGLPSRTVAAGPDGCFPPRAGNEFIDVSMLRKIQSWWRGDLDPAAHDEGETVRDEVETVRGSVPGPNYWGGMHRRETDEESGKDVRPT
jgi:hypothetical protein